MARKQTPAPSVAPITAEIANAIKATASLLRFHVQAVVGNGLKPGRGVIFVHGMTSLSALK